MSGRVAELLGPGGLIARRLAGYEERREQLELTAAVERAIADGRHLLAEAGTGVGKSFAYLLPAVLHAADNVQRGPVVVSTRTIALQQQLERKDLPFLHGVLPIEWSSVTAVGRNNYVCLRRMHLASNESKHLFPDAERAAQLMRIQEWAQHTRDGLRMELDPPADPAVWEEVQAEHGNCLHRACPHYDVCPYQRGRRRMDSAQILVVNHAMYMADVALRMAGAVFLPRHEVVVFDEAHHLQRVATESLGLRVTLAGVLWHLRRLHPRNRKKSLLAQHGTPRARTLVAEIETMAQAFFDDLEERVGYSDHALGLGDTELEDPVSEPLGQLADELARMASGIPEISLRMEIQARSAGVHALQVTFATLCSAGKAGNVRWVERIQRGTALRSAPLDVATALREHVFTDERTAILTSATLGPEAGRAEGEFAWLTQQLGIEGATTLRLGSPFDYATRVTITVEEAMPDPATQPADFLADVKARTLRHVLDNGGRALVLCTSWRFVRELAEYLAPELEDAGIPLLVQGEAPLANLLREKVAAPTSVLVGTDSLWEGIDLPGEALTMLVVTKFPFAQPGHPLTKARLDAITARGGQPFLEHSLPEAILKFRQGFGRLIRSSTDHGKVVVLDPRVRTKRYGRAFLDALPEGLRTS